MSMNIDIYQANLDSKQCLTLVSYFTSTNWLSCIPLPTYTLGYTHKKKLLISNKPHSMMFAWPHTDMHKGAHTERVMTI